MSFSAVVDQFAKDHLAALTKRPAGTAFGILPGARSLGIAALYKLIEPTNRSIVYVTSGSPEAETMASELSLFLPADTISVLPEIDTVPYEWSRRDMVLSGRRIRTLYNITANRSTGVIIAAVGALIRKLPSPALWLNHSVEIQKGKTYQIRELVKKLVSIGYHRTERVEGPGEFCLKGSLLDIFAVQSDQPVRIDFFDIEVESLRRFDVDTQRSLSQIDRLTILPASEAVIGSEELTDLKRVIEKKYDKTLRRPDWLSDSLQSANGRDQPGLEELLAVSMPYLSLDECFATPPVFVLDGSGLCLERALRIEREYQTLYERESDEKVALEPGLLLNKKALSLVDPDCTDSTGDKKAKQYLRILFREEHLDLDQSDASPAAAANPTNFAIKEPSSFGGRMTEFRSRALSILEDNGKVIVTSPYTAQIQRIAGILKSESIPHETVPVHELGQKKIQSKVILVQSLRETGFELPDQNFFVWTDSDIFGRSYKKRIRFKKTGSAPIESYLDLKEGDVVVHINHGVGRFVKLERMKAAGRERDFLVLEYAEEDKLFVPLDQISMVQKYVAPESNPKLDHLGRASFKKIREKVEKNIEEFAEELIQIYAARAKKQGYAFPADTTWQQEFEAEFPFDETPDQLMAIQATKDDMELSKPMDRLICGDVGYGKTEIAIRAIFKAVMSGKQSVVICPTTILALQHFKNFKERFANFPIKVDWASRFRTPKEIKEVKEALAKGEVDVVIGTHALLAKDIRIHNLGLLVIDEEQRFGVAHKEALKKLKTQVDILTLSATPIPRTLHLSLTGIRDLSVIQTPPKDRKPVQTFVLEDSDSALIEAVERELERGGQIFYLHNRIQSLERVAARLRLLLPELRFTMLHGQMHEDDIETILLDFMERKYDLLLTTAIIENGIDIANVNTLIVDRSDQFGLSQLYQIRGRVGRSSRQAYAYFFHEGRKTLTEQGMKRLNTLLEYQELGSGFKVAMRDLEIRGAGNVLGKEQSGDIIQVGYELYIKLLDNAVKRLKGEELDIEVRCSVNLKLDFLLSETYIEDTRQRIEFYKRFEGARSETEVEELAIEMKDRFGPPDEYAKAYIAVERIRTLGSICGFESIYEEEGIVHFKASESFRVPVAHLISVLKQNVGFYVRDGKNNVLYFKHRLSKSVKSSDSSDAEGVLHSLLMAMRLLAEPLIRQLKDES